VRRRVEQRGVVLGAAAVLFVGVFAWRQLDRDAAHALALLYVVPVALVALELGLRAGVAASLLALGLVLLWASTSDAGIGILGVMSHGVVVVSIGAIAGRFSDRMRAAREREADLLESGLALARMAEPQAISATLARCAIRLVGAAGARVAIDGVPPATVGESPADGVELPIETRGRRVGTLRLNCAGARLSPEDRAVLATLAVQAGVAAENRRLLEAERTGALLRGELNAAQKRLADQRDHLGDVLGRHEEERRDVATRLHEECAQSLAAVLLGIGALERAGAPGAIVQPVRDQVSRTLMDLRNLAVRLRPPLLDELGLGPALERLAERVPRAVVLEHAELGRLPPEVETAVYRSLEQLLAAPGPPIALRIGLGAGGETLCIRITGAESSAPSLPLLELIGGRVDVLSGADEGSPIVASIPVSPQPVPV
jgi:signal transduction histidine kinase